MILLDRLLGRKKNPYLKTQGKSKFIISFNHALDGIEYAVNHERNINIEIFAGIITSIMGFIFKISRTVDLVTKEYRDLAKAAKDVSAAAVLVMSMFSVIIGIIIFLPKILNFILN